MSVINWGSVMVIFISLPYSPVELSTCLNMCVCVGKPNAIEFAAISSLQHQLPSQSRLPGHCSSQGKYLMNTFALSRLIQYWIYTQLTVFACSLSLSYSVGWAGWDWSSCCTGPSDQCSLTQSSIQLPPKKKCALFCRRVWIWQTTFLYSTWSFLLEM